MVAARSGSLTPTNTDTTGYAPSGSMVTVYSSPVPSSLPTCIECNLYAYRGEPWNKARYYFCTLSQKCYVEYTACVCCVMKYCACKIIILILWSIWICCAVACLHYSGF